MSSAGDKWGLALSGGGFRAAFFHVGVLAQLAELGVLHQVEVISTVSGGSIIGALYYLHVKRLLETKYDESITPEDYVAIVQQIERHFLQAVQRNIRMRTFLNPLKNLKMVLPSYSRSDRIGELYDQYFYRPVFNPGGRTMVQMQELKIQPCGGVPGFSPRRHNATRNAKVPILLINATALNTGHNWRFEAVRMGEPLSEDEVSKDVDKNLRLLAPEYEQIRHTGHDRFELGLAVAASACVPGLFPPLAVSRLYPRGIRVQLVDGGVHDNLGIEGLRDEGCTTLIVSDASGCLEDETEPAPSTIPTLFRSSDIVMDRVREEELYRLYEGKDQPRLAFMHLRKGLEPKALSWLDPNGKPAAAPQPERAPRFSTEDFEVDPRVQERLSVMRTDLDSFTEVEAYSLMLDGYKMSGRGIPEKLGITPSRPRQEWNFLAIEAWMRKPSQTYLRHLQVGRENLFKVFLLSPAVGVLTGLAAILVLLALWPLLGPRILGFLSTPVTIGSVLLAVILFVIGLVPQLEILRFLRAPSEAVTRIVFRAVLPAIGSLFVAIHLHVFDRMFLHLGTVARLRRNDTRTG